jgi:nicotinic acid mononucleotide adenylyltransferase
VLALGPDNLEPDTFSRFYRAKDIMAEFGVVSIFEQEGARSTFCRKLLAEKDNRQYQTLLNYMPHNVLEYIQQQHLYLSET